jgi:Flp pilus assembly protein TadB
MEETPKTGFNFLLMVEALVAIGVVVVGVLWFAVRLENRVTAIETRLQEEQQHRDTGKREERIDRMEQALQEQARMLQRMVPNAAPQVPLPRTPRSTP